MPTSVTAAHPWLRDDSRPIPLDILVYKLVKAYLHATPFKRAALKALSKALTEDELPYLRAQFRLLEPNRDGHISLENFKMVIYCFTNKSSSLDMIDKMKALVRHATDAMSESRVLDIIHAMEPLAYRKMDFEEFCAAAISIYQLEALDRWEDIASTALNILRERATV
ncbi:EF-hand domain [Sesbania bispinosa]|nr:EF-hand domain [Sesbania bispinosa]